MPTYCSLSALNVACPFFLYALLAAYMAMSATRKRLPWSLPVLWVNRHADTDRWMECTLGYPNRLLNFRGDTMTDL